MYIDSRAPLRTNRYVNLYCLSTLMRGFFLRLWWREGSLGNTVLQHKRAGCDINLFGNGLPGLVFLSSKATFT